MAQRSVRTKVKAGNIERHPTSEAAEMLSSRSQSATLLPSVEYNNAQYSSFWPLIMCHENTLFSFPLANGHRQETAVTRVPSVGLRGSKTRNQQLRLKNA